MSYNYCAFFPSYHYVSTLVCVFVTDKNIKLFFIQVIYHISLFLVNCKRKILKKLHDYFSNVILRKDYFLNPKESLLKKAPSIYSVNSCTFSLPLQIMVYISFHIFHKKYRSTK